MKLTKEQLNKLDKADLVDIIIQLQGGEVPNTTTWTYPYGGSITCGDPVIRHYNVTDGSGYGNGGTLNKN